MVTIVTNDAKIKGVPGETTWKLRPPVLVPRISQTAYTSTATQTPAPPMPGPESCHSLLLILDPDAVSGPSAQSCPGLPAASSSLGSRISNMRQD